MTIREIRRLSGLTQREFAIKYDIPVQTIKGWESSVGSSSHRDCPVYVLELLERAIREDITKGICNAEVANMINFKNIQELAKGEHICINIDEGRYSDNYFMGIDFPLRAGEHYNFYKRECIRDYIDDANSPGDLDAYNAECKLIEFSNLHKEFLFTTAKSIEEGYTILEKKVELWLKLDYDDQISLLDDFILFEAESI